MPFSWFGGIYKDERNFFANFAVDATQDARGHSGAKNVRAEWQAFINDRQGAIVGREAREAIWFYSRPADHVEESDL